MCVFSAFLLHVDAQCGDVQTDAATRQHGHETVSHGEVLSEGCNWIYTVSVEERSKNLNFSKKNEASEIHTISFFQKFWKKKVREIH